MNGPEFNPEAYFRAAWESVQIARPVEYTLFTFGESELPYLLVIDSEQPRQPVSVTKGEVKIARPLIVTPQTDRPEFRHFFDDADSFEGMIDFLLARTAAFRNLRLDNHQNRPELISDNVEEIVARLNRKLDDQEEDRVAILTAPYGLGGVAVLKYAAERVFQSAPGNIQELRERGFLPRI
ncbi:MAG: hypothetical protein R3B90_16420 [Planctomycetaceae bacterium]